LLFHIADTIGASVMSVDVRWGVENHIIQTTIGGNISIEELTTCAKATFALLDSAPYVHSIIDFRQLEHYPPLSDLIRLRSFFSHPNLGWIIIISNDKTVNFFSMIVGSLNNRMRIFPTMEQTLAFLTERDTSFAYPETLANPELA